MEQPPEELPTYILAIRSVSSLLSILGSLFIVGVYVAFKDARTFGRKMITVLSVLDFFAAAAYGIPNAHGWVCSMQSYMISFFVVSSLAWTCCVAAYALLSVSSTLRVEQHFKHFVLFTAVTTLGYMGFAASARPGFATLWCWIPVNEPHALLARGVFFILIWSAWVYNLVVYLIIRRRIDAVLIKQRIASDGRLDSLRTVVYIPLILIMLRMPGSINRAMQEFGADRTPSALHALQALGDPAQGFADAVLFGILNPRIRQRVWTSLRSLTLAPDGDGESGVTISRDFDAHTRGLGASLLPENERSEAHERTSELASFRQNHSFLGDYPDDELR